MPVNIFRVGAVEQGNEKVAGFCAKEWKLGPQLRALDRWLEENWGMFVPGEYVAKVHFRPQPGTSRARAALSREAVRRMAELGMGLFLSEDLE